MSRTRCFDTFNQKLSSSNYITQKNKKLFLHLIRLKVI